MTHKTSLSNCSCSGAAIIEYDDFLTWAICGKCGWATGKYHFTEEMGAAWEAHSRVPRTLEPEKKSDAPRLLDTLCLTCGLHTFLHPQPSKESEALGKWLAAALDDPIVCAEMKADIEAWFEAGQPPSLVSHADRLQVHNMMAKENKRLHDAAQEIANFAWSMVILPNAESREHLNILLSRVREALAGKENKT